MSIPSETYPESSLADSDFSLLRILSERNIEMAFMASADKCTGY